MATTLLLNAAAEERWIDVFQLIAEGTCVNTKDNNGRTVLWHASKQLNVAVVRTLLTLGGSPLDEDMAGWHLIDVALQGAAMNEEIDTIERLTNVCDMLRHAGAPLVLHPAVKEILDDFASIRLYVYLASARIVGVHNIALAEVEIVEGLRRANKLHFRDAKFRSRLHKACEFGSLNAVRALIALGENVNEQCNDGTAIGLAARVGHLEIVRELLGAKADLTLRGLRKRAPVTHWAIKSGNLAVLKLLVDAGAPLNANDEVGNTALCVAISSDQPAMFFKLIELGADIHAKLPYNWTLLHAAAKWNRTWCLAYLIAHGVSVNSVTSTGTPLMVAAQFQSLRAIADLISIHRADVSIGNVMQVAAARSYLSLRLLATLGCDIHKGEEQGSSLLHEAALADNLLCVQWLLQMRHFDVNVRNSEGETALFHAASTPKLEVATWLLHHTDIEIDAVDKEGRSALFYALEDERSATAKLLLEGGARLDVASSALEGVSTEELTAVLQGHKLRRLQ